MFSGTDSTDLTFSSGRMSLMDTRLAELSRTIDATELGRRLRNARVAAGMTQGQLAAGEVTAAYVSRIEDGQRRPEFGLLGRMADRMGTTLSELLDDSTSPERMKVMLALDHAELELRGGEAGNALAAAVRISDDLAPDGAEDLKRRCAVLRAGALEATGDLNAAIRELEKLVASPSRSAEWLRCLISLSRCHREAGDLDRAISVGEDAAAAIEQLELVGMTESIQLTVTVASAYMLRGDLDHALRLCQTAIERAEQAQSPIARASAYWNASCIEARKGSEQAALDLARLALTYFEIGEDSRNLAKLRGHVADMQLDQDPPDALGALETLKRAEAELEWSPGSALDRASQLHTQARAQLLLGELAGARAALGRALALTPEYAAVSRAHAHALQGQIDMEEGDTASARKSFLEAVHLLSGIGADSEAAQLWSDLGGLLRDVGESEAALDAFQRAAASSGLRPVARVRSLPVERAET